MNDERTTEPLFHAEHNPGCPARFGGVCDEIRDDVAVRKADIDRAERDRERRAKDLDDRAAAILNGAPISYDHAHGTRPDLHPDCRYCVDLDAPAGAGDDVEAYRG